MYATNTTHQVLQAKTVCEYSFDRLRAISNFQTKTSATDSKAINLSMDTTAAVLYNKEGYDTGGQKLLGRHSAGEGFLK
ncbi:MAG: hypothetical protein ACMG55_15700, partial [Microcoleus sp.]